MIVFFLKISIVYIFNKKNFYIYDRKTQNFPTNSKPSKPIFILISTLDHLVTLRFLICLMAETNFCGQPVDLTQ